MVGRVRRSDILWEYQLGYVRTYSIIGAVVLEADEDASIA